MIPQPKGSPTAKHGSAGVPQDPPTDEATAKLRAAGSAGDVGGNPPSGGSTANPCPAGPSDYNAVILLADIVDDLEAVRIANENRLRTLTRVDEHGKAVPSGLVAPVSNLVDQLAAIEHGAILELKRAVRRSPLADFQRETVGLGEKTLGRLIKEIGDPAWNDAKDRPRTLRELYAYCGLHVLPAHRRSDSHPTLGGDTGAHRPGDRQRWSGAGESSYSVVELSGGRQFAVPEVPGGGDAQIASDSQSKSGVAPTRVKGQRSNWSTQAKTRLYLIAESMVKNRASAYRHVYDQGRAKYADATHTVECKRCGPSGNPAPIGSDLSDGHKHARAMRLVMKAFLKDLWTVARAHTTSDSQAMTGAGGGEDS